MKKHYLRAGDKVKSILGVAGLGKGLEGTVTSTDGEYVYVKPKRQPFEVEYYRSELDLIKAASDTEHNTAKKKEASKVIKTQEKIIAEAKAVIKEMKNILGS